MVQELASAGTFCPQRGCQHYAEVGTGNNIIIKFGRTKRGVQRATGVRAASAPSPPPTARSFIGGVLPKRTSWKPWRFWPRGRARSEEHTSELQSCQYLV